MFGCGRMGHIRRNCPKGIVNQKEQSESGNRLPHNAKTANEQSTEDLSHEHEESVFGTEVGLSGDSRPAGKWLVDSGASSHMTNDLELIANYQRFEQPERVGLGDGRTVDALGTGKVYVQVRCGVAYGKVKRLVLTNVLYVPKLACNLFSVRAATSHGNSIKFSTTKCWIHDSKGKLYGMGTLVDKLYQLDSKPIENLHVSTGPQERREPLDLWHQRLGHLNIQYIRDIAGKYLVIEVKIPKTGKISFCEGCVEGKMQRATFRSVGEIRSQRRLELIHSDVCVPMSMESLGGMKYFVTFVDDYSRCCAVYFLKYKSELSDSVCKYSFWMKWLHHCDQVKPFS